MELVAHLLVIERMIKLDKMLIQQIRKVWHMQNYISYGINNIYLFIYLCLFD